ncbi:tRNA (guanosine(37)-N1)-methyltransferase TrmD [Prochlorococcus sp. MIT 1223]|uniref:tRNA (guanosine(37)-N1)-methyltransferase TrmD n=1 Tax=Prochlorococcus sp. MIT 1223 TaxID=3096217 RepID=UPI002A755FC2|nr:tRNA (guanosine(37)-N1)-methyltransferase TrmD [Prochlorococcus sp. MIT 1223]
MTFCFDVVTLLPKVFESVSEQGVIGRAFSQKIAQLNIHNPRDFATDRYRKVDDEPYGGGAGMVLKPEPVFAAYQSIKKRPRKRVLILSPQGIPLVQSDLKRWSIEHDQLILICGQYEGFDERIRTLAEEEISLGDFVLTGGELPALTIINGVTRLLSGTLGAPESLLEESHVDGLLEHPHYTRPAEFLGMKVPQVLKSGDHQAISKWRNQQKEQRTKIRRPALYEKWLLRNPSFQKERNFTSTSSVEFLKSNEYDPVDDPWLD